MSRTQTFHSKCHDLATQFLRPDAWIELKNALAATIQERIEEFMEDAGEVAQ